MIAAVEGVLAGDLLIRDFAEEMRIVKETLAPALEAGRPASASGISSNQCKGCTGRENSKDSAQE